jgi:hypothetical protein
LTENETSTRSGCDYGDELMFCRGGELTPPDDVLINSIMRSNPCPKCNTRQHLYAFLQEASRMLGHQAAPSYAMEFWTDAVSEAMRANRPACLACLKEFGAFSFPTNPQVDEPALQWPMPLPALSSHDNIEIMAVIEQNGASLPRTCNQVVSDYRRLNRTG